MHAGGGLAHRKEETGFQGDSGHAFTNDQSNLQQNRAGRFEPVLKLLIKAILSMIRLHKSQEKHIFYVSFDS